MLNVSVSIFAIDAILLTIYMLALVEQSALIQPMPKMVNVIHALQNAILVKVQIFVIVVMTHIYCKLKNVSKSAVMAHIMQVV